MIRAGSSIGCGTVDSCLQPGMLGLIFGSGFPKTKITAHVPKLSFPSNPIGSTSMSSIKCYKNKCVIPRVECSSRTFMQVWVFPC